MVSDLVKNLTREVMLELAGETYFKRGEGYYQGGHVYDLVEYGGVIVAKVAGTEDYRVRLWAEDGLAYSCDCPLGLDGEFCKHCVAAGLAWLEGDNSEDAPGGSATMDDVRTYLEDQDKDLLVRIVMEQAMEDEGLRERLLLRASRMGGLDLSFPVDHSRLVEILLWEGNVEEAWREAKEGGCSDRLWLDLAARREEGNPEDALTLYQERIEPLVNQTDNKAYRKAYELSLKVRTLMYHLGREAEFEEYVELLRLEYKRKRNFMKLLDGME